MGLSEREKQIALAAWRKTRSENWIREDERLLFTVEAVLAEREREEKEPTMESKVPIGVKCRLCGHDAHHGSCVNDAPVQPAPDVVERMGVAYFKACDESADLEAMTAAFQIARDDRDEQWEKAVIEESYSLTPSMQTMGLEFIERVRKRLSQPKEPTLQEKVYLAIEKAVRKEESISGIAVEIIALVKESQ